ncbi:MAG: S-layer homology domain-containing protein, partial [Bacillota bacterium]|nr:S-layer homology domain-containing protein [Bacillota bacterium]
PMNRVLKVVAAALMMMCLVSAPLAAAAAPRTFPDVGPELEAVVALVSRLGIMVGYDDGGFHPDRPFIREHLGTVVVRLRGLEPEAKALAGTVASMYADARPADWWSNGYLIVAFNQGLMIGDAPDAQGRRFFRPSDDASLDEVLTITIRVLLGQKLEGPWPGVYREKAVEMGLLRIVAERTGRSQAGILSELGPRRASRGEIAEVIYTALTGTVEGQALARTLEGVAGPVEPEEEEETVAVGDERGIISATVSSAMFGCVVTVTTNYTGARRYRVFDGATAVSLVTELGSPTTVFPARQAGGQVTVRLYADDGVTVIVEQLVTLTG